MRSLWIVVYLIASNLFYANIVVAEPENNIDRMGSDYFNFDLDEDSYLLCESRCDSERQCLAWTYVKPGVQTSSARCYLKNSVPPPRSDACCISGLKSSDDIIFGPLDPYRSFGVSMWVGINYPGYDYNRTTLSQNDPKICKRKCSLDTRCGGYTYVRPRVRNASASCFLKNRSLTRGVAARIERRDNCCTSGLKTIYTKTRSTADDVDGDGLPDAWERANPGLGLSTTRIDLIIVPVLRPELTLQDVQGNLDLVKAFFSKVPLAVYNSEFRVLSHGINVIFQPGRPLDRSFRYDQTPRKEYREARVPGMPPELIGYAHGLFIDLPAGGQKSGVDWASVGNSWTVMVHELGHQLGLDHFPLDNKENKWSPLYTSLMNYNYQNSFDGQSLGIHFSRGLLDSTKLSEDSVIEVLQYPLSVVSYLKREPYNFTVARVRNNQTSVDFNRNTIARERNVSADVNDGYSFELVKPRGGDEAFNIAQSEGAFSMAAQGERLITVYTDIPDVNPADYVGRGASTDTPARLLYRVSDSQNVLSGGVIDDTPSMTGSPDTMSWNQRFFVVYPSENNGGFTLSVYRLTNRERLEYISGILAQTRENVDVSLFSTKNPNGLYVMEWNKVTQEIYVRRITSITPVGLGHRQRFLLRGPRDYEAVPLKSNTPPSAVWNSKHGMLMIAVTRGSQNRLKLVGLSRNAGNSWILQGESWLATENAQTQNRPTLLFDDRPAAGETGHYLAYVRRNESLNDAVNIDFVRKMPNAFTRRRQIVNQWMLSRSAPAAAFFGDDIAVAIRKPDNQIELFLGGDGFWSEDLSDFDDVSYIGSEGLRKLEGLRGP